MEACEGNGSCVAYLQAFGLLAKVSVRVLGCVYTIRSGQ